MGRRKGGMSSAVVRGLPARPVTCREAKMSTTGMRENSHGTSGKMGRTNVEK